MRRVRFIRTSIEECNDTNTSCRKQENRRAGALYRLMHVYEALP